MVSSLLCSDCSNVCVCGGGGGIRARRFYENPQLHFNFDAIFLIMLFFSPDFNRWMPFISKALILRLMTF